MGRSIAEIAEEMWSLVSNKDHEIAHSQADQLLVEALKSIAKCDIEREPIRLLLYRYKKVGKWYA